jgi:hypothetical protein
MDYLFIDQLPSDQQDEFILWLCGKTCPVIEKQEERRAAYVQDYRQWVFKIRGVL